MRRTEEEQAEFNALRGVHLGDRGWTRFQQLAQLRPFMPEVTADDIRNAIGTGMPSNEKHQATLEAIFDRAECVAELLKKIP